jgi:hypothetical protein
MVVVVLLVAFIKEVIEQNNRADEGGTLHSRCIRRESDGKVIRFRCNGLTATREYPGDLTNRSLSFHITSLVDLEAYPCTLPKWTETQGTRLAHASMYGKPLLTTCCHDTFSNRADTSIVSCSGVDVKMEGADCNEERGMKGKSFITAT